MKILVGLFVIFTSLFFNFKSAFAFDFAPEVGDIAPSFHLEGINKSLKSKTIWDSDELIGKWIVLYFYPKDFTAGCTLEAKGFSELKKDFIKYNAEIIGISADNQDSHETFCSEKSINYTLLSDPNGIISEKYGSWIPPFSDRNTFLISPEGKIRYRWISVLPINHAKEVLNVLKKII